MFEGNVQSRSGVLGSCRRFAQPVLCCCGATKSNVWEVAKTCTQVSSTTVWVQCGAAHMVLAADASAMLCCTVLYCRAAAAMGLACAFPGRLDSAMNDLQSVTLCRPHLLVVIVVVIAKHLGLEVNYTDI